MDLDIKADENGFGGQIERPLSLSDLEQIKHDPELSEYIIGFRYVLCLVPRDLGSHTFFSDESRIATMFLHRDRKFRLVTGDGGDRSDQTWVMRKDDYVPAQRRGLNSLLREDLPSVIKEKILNAVTALELGGGPNVPLPARWIADPALTPPMVGRYQGEVLAASRSARSVSYQFGKAAKHKPAMFMAPELPHFRGIDPTKPFPKDDGVHVLDIPYASHHRT